LNQKVLKCDYSNEIINTTTGSVSDTDLLHLTASGDESAFCELYKRYSGPIFYYLLRLIHEKKDAEDLLQEVFLAVWKGARNFRGQSQVKTWLYRIAHHQAISWLRRYKKVASFDDLFETDRRDGPEEVVSGHWPSDQIQEALDTLSSKQREVIELTFIHRMSYTEIAEIMGCPVGTIKSRMSYALRMLNDMIKSDIKINP
jgi:RNA polymerase sigma-70 factor (ECF subfamily)